MDEKFSPFFPKKFEYASFPNISFKNEKMLWLFFQPFDKSTCMFGLDVITNMYGVRAEVIIVLKNNCIDFGKPFVFVKVGLILSKKLSALVSVLFVLPFNKESFIEVKIFSMTLYDIALVWIGVIVTFGLILNKKSSIASEPFNLKLDDGKEYAFIFILINTTYLYNHNRYH